ncbi:hypothetical protein [Streptosporangium vulgare]
MGLIGHLPSSGSCGRAHDAFSQLGAISPGFSPSKAGGATLPSKSASCSRGSSYLRRMPRIEERINTVEPDIAEIKKHLSAMKRSTDAIEKNIDVMRDNIVGLKAGQIEIRDLLTRVVARLENVAS